jgi:hypothetical protein
LRWRRSRSVISDQPLPVKSCGPRR